MRVTLISEQVVESLLPFVLKHNLVGDLFIPAGGKEEESGIFQTPFDRTRKTGSDGCCLVSRF